MDSPIRNNSYLGRYRRTIEPITKDPLIRGYFEIVATILLVAFFLIVAVRPTLNTVFGLRRKIADLEDVNKRLDGKINSLIAAQSTYAKFDPQLSLLNRALPGKPEIDTMIIDIENITKENGMSVVSLTVGATGLTPDAWERNAGFVRDAKSPLSFTLTVSGNFADEQKLIKSFVSNKRVYSISSLNFSRSDSKTNELNCVISGVGYFLPN